MTLFAIGITPVYKTVIASSQIQKAAEKRYEATCQAQSLLEKVKRQMEADLSKEYALSRGIGRENIKDWLGLESFSPIDSIPDFLDIEELDDLEAFQDQYGTQRFSYELYIGPIVQAHTDQERLMNFGEITYQAPNSIKVRGLNNIHEQTHIESLEGLGRLITHEIIILEPINRVDIIQLEIDLTSFPQTDIAQLIRIENQSKATVIIPLYSEKNLGGIEIFPIQKNPQGTMIVKQGNKLTPMKSFMIKLVVKDKCNTTFGESNKVLSQLTDIYAYDYNKKPHGIWR